MGGGQKEPRAVTYSVEFLPRAAKQLGALPKNARHTIVLVIDALSINPIPTGATIVKQTPFHRVRIRDYRVIYAVEKNVLRVLVVRVAHRRDAYRNL